jgi:hypothetical protein
MFSRRRTINPKYRVIVILLSVHLNSLIYCQFVECDHLHLSLLFQLEPQRVHGRHRELGVVGEFNTWTRPSLARIWVNGVLELNSNRTSNSSEVSSTLTTQRDRQRLVSIFTKSLPTLGELSTFTIT